MPGKQKAWLQKGGGGRHSLIGVLLKEGYDHNIVAVVTVQIPKICENI